MYPVIVPSPWSEMPFPKACPTCGADWGGWIRGPDKSYLGVDCENGCNHEFALTPAQQLQAELAMFSHALDVPAAARAAQRQGMT